MSDTTIYKAEEFAKGAELHITRKLAPLGFSKSLTLLALNNENQLLIIQEDNVDSLPFSEREAGEQTGDQAARTAYEQAKILIKDMDQVGYIHWEEKGKPCYHSFIKATITDEEDKSLNYGFIPKNELKEMFNDPLLNKIIAELN